MIIAIIGAGQMGSAIAARCVAGGAEVITPLSGRSQASKDRAAVAGMRPCGLSDLSAARLILSILPSSEAQRVAEAILPHLSKDGPLFVDANALAPNTKLAMAAQMEEVGRRFADGVIIGSPPRMGEPGPRLYVSGQHGQQTQFLCDLGLDVRILDGPVGTAAALKMCYAALNKGLTALTVAALLAANDSGVAKALIGEWGISQTHIAERAQKAVPAMYPKASRWVSEFEEIARFSGEKTTSGALFEAFARFFCERAAENDDGSELRRLMTALQGECK